jgi:hypothetical protein
MGLLKSVFTSKEKSKHADKKPSSQSSKVNEKYTYCAFDDDPLLESQETNRVHYQDYVKFVNGS